MSTTSTKLLTRLAITLATLSLTACAHLSTSTPPVVVEKSKPTPLPAEVQQIDPSDSAPLLKKLSDFRAKLNGLFGNETAK